MQGPFSPSLFGGALGVSLHPNTLPICSAGPPSSDNTSKVPKGIAMLPDDLEGYPGSECHHQEKLGLPSVFIGLYVLQSHANQQFPDNIKDKAAL